MFFDETVNRITSRDYNPIFDTDFASLVRYDRFPSHWCVALVPFSGFSFPEGDSFIKVVRL